MNEDHEALAAARDAAEAAQALEAAQGATFEVLAEDGLRWIIKAKDERELDDFIDRGVIVDAAADGFAKKGWRLNCSKITAYRPSE